ncbi:phosphatidic acid phosphatase type 2/haloperoxidase [Gautieria morchelliformis]|nr:phosphatidic acid phosphatase type 2/haloperoxidase [Gautieria morchelliformis]
MSSVLPTHLQQSPHLGFFRLQRRKEPVDKQRRMALFLSYAPDWVLTLLIVGLFFLLDTVEPFKREFSLDDTSYNQFEVQDQLQNANVVLIAVVAPLVLMVVINMISIRSFWDCHTSWLGAILGIAITGSITQIVKVTVGRPRPDCIDRCQPRPGSANHAVFGLVNATICTQTDNSILKDGFRSFPSGHSSLSFAGLGFLSFYLAGKLHLFDQRGYTGKAWISVVPLMGAALVAISRTMDYRHHWQDVVVGSLLGLSLAWYSYRQYYPALSHPLSHRPYSPRISRNRTPLSGLRMHDSDHFNQAGEPEGLHPSRDSCHTDHDERTQGISQGTPVDHDTPISLKEVWKQGEGEEILPPGQVPSSGPVSDSERV